MSKLLVSDYDKTFYLNDYDIEKNKSYVNKFINLGNMFVIATGRSYQDFHEKLDIYKFNYDYVILNHGSTIIDKNNKILFNSPIPNEIISQIKNSLDLNNCINYFCCSGTLSRVNFEYKDITKINVKYNTKKEASEKVNYINNKYCDWVKSYLINEYSIEIISNKTNKAIAINCLIKYFNNINKNNVYVIGNGYSDIEMVKEFNGYCMIESIDELKKIAKKEYDSVSTLIEEILDEDKE